MIPRLRFVEEGHKYLLDGKPVVSNTQLLGAEGLIDTTFYTVEGRERGSRVHAACWFIDEGDLDWKTVAEEERGYVKAFERFKRECEWATDFNELAVWGNSIFGTRLDLLGVGVFQVNGEFTRRRAVIDIKTGSVPAWVELQLAGQFLAVTERIQASDEPWTEHLEYFNGHPYPELRFALQLKKDGKYYLKEYTDPGAMDVFTGLIKTYHWKAKNGYHKKPA